MISINNLTKSFGDQLLFEGLTFNVARRERIGLVGRNGHGKTTLFRLIRGEIVPDEGEIVIPKRYRIGWLDQHIEFTQPTALDEAALGLPETDSDQVWKAEKILSGLGFTESDMSRPPEVFSGGYQVRLNLAKVLLSEPDLLLLDEPTNYLDVVSIRWLARFLNSWPSELLLITHDRAFMDSVTTHTVGIHRRSARKIEGGTGKLYDQILLEEEVYEKTRANDEKKRKEIERFVERFRAKNTLATRVQSRIKYLEKHNPLEKLDRIQSLDFSFNAAPFPAKVMAKVEDVTFAYDGSPDIIRDLSIEIRTHDRICVIGQNGKGKSTLLRLLAEQLAPRRGVIERHNRVVTGYFAQTNVDTLHPGNTVADEIRSGDGGCLPQTARNIAGAMMFEGDDALKKVSVLSGGEKSRVMLGKLLVTPCNLLLLDEPTNHLDMDSTDSLLAAVDDFAGAVVMVTHNEMFLHSLATRFVVFDRGRVRVFENTYQDFLDQIGWEMDDLLRPRKEKPAVVAETTSPPAPAPAERKMSRQERAKFVQERARTIGPLEKRIAALEKQITDLETRAAEITEALTAASVSGDAASIASLSKENTEVAAKIDDAFEELESATSELDAARKRFE